MNTTARKWLILPLALVAVSAVQGQQDRVWPPLANDGLHDPESAALQLLQDPGEALSLLPADSAGNQVDWVKAIGGRYIKPRSGLLVDREIEVLELDVVMNQRGGTPKVLFPHKVHTQWLDCQNCHEKPFATSAGTTPVTMLKILQGEYCGVCHGAVAFPLTECSRCHSIPRK